MSQVFSDLLTNIAAYSGKPALFEPGELHFWDDPHISKAMLETHLNPALDLASRRPETIDKEVKNLVSSGVVKKGDNMLDLGCGPGLYASRLARQGIKVTGIDFSERSLNYAIAQAKEQRLDIRYRLLNFFDLGYASEFDAVLQAYGEIGTFSDVKRDELFTKIHRSLKPGGTFIFDVTTPSLKMSPGPHNQWYITDGGFWRPGRHLTLEMQYDYPEENVSVSQYIVMDEKKTSVYRIWNHNYTPESLRPVLEKAGFRIVHTWNDLTGTPYQEGGEWLAIAARKR